jgi:hypothetical protein
MLAFLSDGFSFVAGRVSARRPNCLSFFDGFSFVASRVSARRPIYFLLLRQKKVAQEKATRVRVSLRCAKGNLRCSQQAGSLQTRLSPQTCNLLYPPVTALLGTRTRESEGTSPRFALGIGDREALTFATATKRASTQTKALSCPSGSRFLPLRWCKAPAAAPGIPVPPTPLCVRRAAQGSAERAGRMFEPAGRVCGTPALREQRRLPRCAAPGSQTPGSPFFCLLFFGEAKKSEAPAGAQPGLPHKQKLPSNSSDPARYASQHFTK